MKTLADHFQEFMRANGGKSRAELMMLLVGSSEHRTSVHDLALFLLDRVATLEQQVAALTEASNLDIPVKFLPDVRVEESVPDDEIQLVNGAGELMGKIKLGPPDRNGDRNGTTSVDVKFATPTGEPPEHVFNPHPLACPHGVKWTDPDGCRACDEHEKTVEALKNIKLGPERGR